MQSAELFWIVQLENDGLPHSFIPIPPPNSVDEFCEIVQSVKIAADRIPTSTPPPVFCPGLDWSAELSSIWQLEISGEPPKHAIPPPACAEFEEITQSMMRGLYVGGSGSTHPVIKIPPPTISAEHSVIVRLHRGME